MDIWQKKAPTNPGTMSGWAQKENPSTRSGAPATSASQSSTASSGGASSGSPTAPARGNSGGSRGASDRDNYWANKEARDLEKEKVYREVDLPAIRRSTSYNVAATLAAAALANDTLSFGSAAKGKRLDMFLGYLDQIADHVYARINGETPEVISEPAEGEADEQDSLG